MATAVVLLVISNILHFTLGAGVMSGQVDWRMVYANPLVWSTVLGVTSSQLELALPEWVKTSRTIIGRVLYMVLSAHGCVDKIFECLVDLNVLVTSNCWIQRLPVQTHPCFHTSLFCSSRQAMIWVAFENTDSISTRSIGSVGNSGFITRLTRKCFCLAKGVTAVHFVNSSFLGLKAFIGAPDNERARACL